MPDRESVQGAGWSSGKSPGREGVSGPERADRRLSGEQDKEGTAEEPQPARASRRNALRRRIATVLGDLSGPEVQRADQVFAARTRADTSTLAIAGLARPRAPSKLPEIQVRGRVDPERRVLGLEDDVVTPPRPKELGNAPPFTAPSTREPENGRQVRPPRPKLSLAQTTGTPRPRSQNRHRPLLWTTGAASAADPTARAPRGSR